MHPPDGTMQVSHGPARSPRTRLGALRDAAARARAGDGADREGLHRSGRARSHHRGLRDQGRAAQRRARGGQGLERSRLQAGAARRRLRGGRARSATRAGSATIWSRSRTRPRCHNMVVCTLCSCYPWEVLGLPPVWYKSAPYRSRAVKDPRGVLADFGVTLPEDTEIRVWDSTAETRFLVLPMRPAGTDGWSEERLAALVTRDAMIGTGLPKRPRRSPDGRRPRHGRHGRLRQGRARAERAGVPRAVGRPRARDAARHGLRRRVATSTCRAFAQERLPPHGLSHRVLLPALGAGDWSATLVERGFVGADELAAGHALRPGKPLARKLDADDRRARA